MDTLFTVTAEDDPVSIVSAGDAASAVSITERLLEVGARNGRKFGRWQIAILRSRRPTDIEIKSFRERAGSWHGEAKFAAIPIE